MKNPVYQKLWPVLAAIVAFLIITAAYFHPLLEGKRLRQSDITQFRGMSKEIVDYRAKTGEEALWTNSMFGGMPAYQISVQHKGNLMTYVDRVLQLDLPRPAGFVFLYFLGFFLLLMAMGISPWLSVTGAIAFAFSSFFFIVIEAGHNSQAHAIAYMAPVLAAMIFAFKKKYLLGGALMALFLALQINANHLQITFYLALLAFIYGIFEFINAYKEKELNSFFKAVGVLFVGALLAIGPNISNLWTTAEYTAASNRGKSELTNNAHLKTSGLDKDYATQWSYGIDETMSLLIPNVKGGASDYLGNNPTAMKEVKEEMKTAISQQQSYWGNQPFTSGPVYLGAFVFFLFILGMFIVDDRIKWPLFTAFVLSILLAWGHNFSFLTNLFLDYFPGYNKFRSVSMILVLAELVAPIIAILGLKKVIEKPEVFKTKKLYVYISLGLTAGVALIIYLFPGIFGLISNAEFSQIENYRKQGAPAAQLADFVSSLEAARRTIITGDALRSFMFIVVGVALLWAYTRKIIKANVLVPIIAILIIADMAPIDSRYLGSKNYDRKSAIETPFQPSQVDEFIMKDKDPDFRVLNMTVNPFADASTSYFHMSVGGYHAAKLKRYDELIEYQISKSNQEVINMLNTKYLIVPGQDKTPTVQINFSALGNAWFVRNYKMVPNADAELNALSNFKAAQTAVIDSRFEKDLASFKFSPNDTIGNTIKLTSYSPNHLVYQSNAQTDQLAVFSEIYYEKGWKASIDGKDAPYFRANYVLRSMVVPAGKHTIEYKFEPRSYILGTKLSLAASILLLLVLAGVLYVEVKKGCPAKKEEAKA